MYVVGAFSISILWYDGKLALPGKYHLTLLDRHPLPVQRDTVWVSAPHHYQSVPGRLAGVCVVLPE